MLYKSTFGTGEDLVLLHGWGFSGRIFNNLIEEYSKKYKITIIDLPGHGKSSQINDYQSWYKEIIKILPSNSIIVGWSLGGLLAIKIATEIQLKKLVLIAASPKFIQDKDWQFGIDKEIFRNFAESLEKDPIKTLKRFISLQSNSKDKLKKIKNTIESNPPTLDGLKNGLEILMNYDLRKELSLIKSNITVYLGEKDTLIPKEIKTWYESKGVSTFILKGGHAPFLNENFYI